MSWNRIKVVCSMYLSKCARVASLLFLTGKCIMPIVVYFEVYLHALE